MFSIKRLKRIYIVKCLVVIAHPLENSLCQHIAKETIEHLVSIGYQVTIKDLYQENFNPVLTESERTSYYQDQFDDSKLKHDIKQLTSTETLVLIFPTWWFGFPAILKGWFDRVWAPSHAYNHDSDLGPLSGNLNQLKEVKVVTTLGSPWWVDLFILRKPVKRILKTAIVGTCTKGCSFKMLTLYKSEKLSAKQISNFINKIKSVF